MSDRPTSRSKTIDLALERFKLCVDAEQKQRSREAEDLRFQVPELQWPDDVKGSRAGQVVAGVAIPARPMLSIPKLDQPIQLVINQERAAHLGVKIEALSEDADDATAETIQGLYRQIERDSRANLARGWAYDRGVKAGRGEYRIDKVYDPDGGHFLDQKLVFKRILHQGSVYRDPFAQEPDWSDGLYAFVTLDMPFDRYKQKHPKTQLAQMNDGELGSVGDEAPEWVTGEGPGCTVRVAEYWRVDITTTTRVLLDDGTDADEDDIPKGRTAVKGKSRQVETRKVFWSIINAIEEVEPEQEWDGQYIPLIPVIGKELQPFDGERRWVGIIGPAKDGQRLFNYSASNAVEMAALEPKAPFIGVEGQFEGHETEWQQANIRNFPYLEYKRTGLAGEPDPAPQRAQIDAGRLGPSMMLLQQADSFIQAATTTLDQSKIEAMGKRRVAHQTINALQQQSEFGTSHFLDNLSNISITYEAKVMLDLIPHVYDRPGRVARILDKEDTLQTVILNQPFVTDPHTKRPKPIPVPPEQAGPMAADERNPVKHFDLKKGRYGVSVSVGKSYQSRVEEGASEIGDVLANDPALMPLIGPIYFKYRQFPGHTEIAELLKKVRAKQFPGLEDEEGSGQQDKAKLQQAEQMLQQLQQQMQEMAKALETDKAKQDAQVAIKTAEFQHTLRLAEMNNAARIRIAEINAATKGLIIDHEQQHEAQALGAQQQFEAQEAEADRTHEAALTAMDHQQTLEQMASMPLPSNNGGGE